MILNNLNKKLVLVVLFAFILYGCGTVPWLMKRKIYKTYKEPVYKGLKKFNLRTDGFYIQKGKLDSNDSYRTVIIFFEKGYLTTFSLLDEDIISELREKIYNPTKIISTDLDWWMIYGDSLIIEYYFEMKRQMVTSNYYQRGILHNDTLIELRFDSSGYETNNTELFRFIKSDSLPTFINKGRYLKKDWYNLNLHETRR
jgi:hypothetical protein